MCRDVKGEDGLAGEDALASGSGLWTLSICICMDGVRLGTQGCRWPVLHGHWAHLMLLRRPLGGQNLFQIHSSTILDTVVDITARERREAEFIDVRVGIDVASTNFVRGNHKLQGIQF